jgi:hypothetical protein
MQLAGLFLLSAFCFSALATVPRPPTPKPVLQSPKAATVQKNSIMAAPVAPKTITLSFEQRDCIGQVKPMPFDGFTFYIESSTDLTHWQRIATNQNQITVSAVNPREVFRVNRTSP